MGSISTPSDFHTEALIIGAGFSGIYSLYRLRKLGIPAKIIDAGNGYGGTWHWNRYPGARVDSETPFYQLSIPEVWRTWNFSERFPGHEELRQYFDHVDKVLNLRKDTIFNTIVEGVHWDGQWTCHTRDGRTVTCKYLLLCTGSSYKKHYPDFKGLRDFAGTLIHSAAYPEGGIDVKGKKVAVVGSGATGVQIVQELAKEDCELTAFIRTPNTALPMRQRKMTEAEQESLKNFYDALFRTAKDCRAGFSYNVCTQAFADSTEEERNARFEDLWQRGGFAYLISNYREFLVNKEVNKVMYDFWAKKVRERMTDPVKRDIVAPIKQEHHIGTKRPSLEQDYYESLDRPNVKIVNLKTTRIVEFTKEGIQTDQLLKFDIIILATGYDSLTGSLMDLKIKDKDGKLLQEKWEQGVETYLGLMIHKMPNAFMTYSPQAPTSLANGPPIIEIQVDWIGDAIMKMKEEGIDAIDAQEAGAKKWRKDIQDMNAMTLYPLENSWYMGANIPGKVREQLIYLGGVDVYGKKCKEALEGWQGFDLIRSEVSSKA